MFNVQKSQFKIQRHLGKIVRFVRDNIKTGVIAPTGYGKSLGIPYAMVKTMPNIKVMVVVPTTNAAKNLYQSQQLLSDKPIDTGYATLEAPKYNQSSKIIYATSSYVRNLMLSYVKDGKPVGKLDFANILMVDEIHIGSIDNYIIINLWNYFFRYYESQNIQGGLPRILISSATLNKEEYPDFIFYEIEDTHHSIIINYNEKDYNEHNIERYRDMANKIILSHQSQVGGHFLVFVPGKNEIDKVIRNLDSIKSTSMIIPAYSGLSRENIQRIYSPSNLRKIIVSTNVSETAITITDISVVFDSMLERKIEGGENPKLAIDFISKSSADQRAGRTGRTMSGICYRMTTQESYQTLAESRQPEIYRSPLYGIIMSLINVGINPLNVLPKEIEILTRIRDSIPVLKDLKYISLDNKITKLGKFYQLLNLEIRISAILYWWIKTGNPIDPGIIIISIINNYGPSYAWFDLGSIDNNVGYLEKQNQLNQYRNKFFSKYIGRSDLHTFVNMWNDLMRYINSDIKDSSRILAWATSNSINHKKIRQVITTVNHTSRTLINNGYITDFNWALFETDKYIDLIRPVIRHVYSTKKLIYGSHKGGVYTDENTGEEYRINPNMNLNKLLTKPAVQIIPFEILGNLIVFSLNIDPEDLNKQMVLDAVLSGKFKFKRPTYGTRRTENIYGTTDIIDTDVSGLKKSYEPEPAHPLQMYTKIGKKFLSD